MAGWLGDVLPLVWRQGRLVEGSGMIIPGIVLLSFAMYSMCGLLMARDLYGLWRANKLDKLMADPEAIRVQSGDWRTLDTYRARTLKEAQAVYMKTSPPGGHGEHLFFASLCGAFWPLVVPGRFTWKGCAWLLRRARKFVTGSPRKPARLIAAEKAQAEVDAIRAEAERQQKIKDMEEELGWK